MGMSGQRHSSAALYPRERTPGTHWTGHWLGFRADSCRKCSSETRQHLLTCKKVKQPRYTPWRRLGGEEYSSYSFTTSALDGGEWSASHPGRAFTPGERNPGTRCTGGWVGPRAGLDTEVRGKILCLCRGSNPDRPVVQPVVRHYTARANPAPPFNVYGMNKLRRVVDTSRCLLRLTTSPLKFCKHHSWYLV
jgi:hypothetical protein